MQYFKNIETKTSKGMKCKRFCEKTYRGTSNKAEPHLGCITKPLPQSKRASNCPMIQLFHQPETSS